MAKETKVEKIEVLQLTATRWAVPSSSEPGVSREVELVDGGLVCNCPAPGARTCRHKRAVMTVVEGLKLEGERKLEKTPEKGTTVNGYRFDEVASAFHKEIRRGDEEMALFWGLELYETAQYYFWKRVLIQVAEDIGLASPETVREVVSLAQAWEMAKKASWGVDPQHVVMAIILMARAPKSNEVDDAKNFIIERRKKGWRPAVPDYAVDGHTAKGKAMGRDDAFWYAERATMIEPSPYLEKLKAVCPETFQEKLV